MAVLEFNNVCKSYRKSRVVKNLSFTVDKGEILGLVGANGAGKSTCISMIATLLKPDSGTILYEGQDIVREPAAIRKGMGYVPQDIALYETLSGYDNLRFWGKSYGVSSAELGKEIARVSEYIGFDRELLKKRVSEYSGGMKRRLNIGAALLHRPGLLLLDEPTAGIDAKSGEAVLRAIRQLREEGTAIIYVGHYPEEVCETATHLCVLHEGERTAFGRIDEVLQGRRLSELY